MMNIQTLKVRFVQAWVGVVILFYPTKALFSQTTYWVSNDPAHAELFDFTNLQTAINTAIAGDTLVVFPTGISYGTITVNKSLFIESIGYNYSLETQPLLDIHTLGNNAIIQTLNFSNMQGCSVSGLQIAYVQVIGSSSIDIWNSAIGSIQVENSDYCSILGNYIGGTFTYTNYHVYISESNNILMANNIFWQTDGSGPKTNLYFLSSGGNVGCFNNVFFDRVDVHNGVIRNNIFLSPQAFFYNCEVDFNVFVGDIAGSPPNNLYNVDPASIFVGYPTQGDFSFDSRYQLLPSSPAREYGENGVDCGVFDGDFPYRLSGITKRPLVSELEVPLSAFGDEMEITVRVKIINN